MQSRASLIRYWHNDFFPKKIADCSHEKRAPEDLVSQAEMQRNYKQGHALRKHHRFVGNMSRCGADCTLLRSQTGFCGSFVSYNFES